jgi:ElaB/YqjD/DUF883 family membrane-anchored ribosome-binding protein
MNTPVDRPMSAYPFPDSDSSHADRTSQGALANATVRVADAAVSAREHLADAVLDAQARAEEFRDTAAGYIRCYPFRSVATGVAIGFLAGLLCALRVR